MNNPIQDGPRKVRVLIVDDSTVMRSMLKRHLSCDPEIEIVGSASDPYIAREKIIQLKPDVLTLDIEMPRMDGITFLEKLKTYYPMPVVVLSALTPSASEIAFKALELGAVEVMHKPIVESPYQLQEMMIMLADKLKAAAKIKEKYRSVRDGIIKERTDLKLPEQANLVDVMNRVVVIGASTGGVEALRSILPALPSTFCGTVIVQHMPPQFTSLFAKDLNKICRMEVQEAKDGDTVRPGLVLVGPGNYHLLLKRSGQRYYVEVSEGPLVCRQRPSVEVLFNSVAKCAQANAIGVILTGMGNDGAKGLLTMKESGAFTIAQDEASSVVFGMPKEAIALNAALKVMPLEDIPGELVKQLQKG